MSSRAVVLVATIGALAVASGCTDSGTEPAGRGAGTQSGDGVGAVETTAADEATETDPAQTRLGSVCREPESRLRALAEEASAFEDVHSVTETPASILAAVTALAAASSVHPDDCVALIKAHAVRRSGCHPGVRTYPWMGCDFNEDRDPAS